MPGNPNKQLSPEQYINVVNSLRAAQVQQQPAAYSPMLAREAYRAPEYSPSQQIPVTAPVPGMWDQFGGYMGGIGNDIASFGKLLVDDFKRPLGTPRNIQGPRDPRTQSGVNISGDPPKSKADIYKQILQGDY